MKCVVDIVPRSQAPNVPTKANHERVVRAYVRCFFICHLCRDWAAVFHEKQKPGLGDFYVRADYYNGKSQFSRILLCLSSNGLRIALQQRGDVIRE